MEARREADLRTFEPVGAENLEDLRAFCRRHRPRLDDSFLTDDELAMLAPSEDAPGWLLREDAAGGPPGGVRAAASLLLDAYHRRGRRARFRILFDAADDPATYAAFLELLRPAAAAAGAEHWFLFVPDGEDALRVRLEGLGFRYERSGWVLERGPLPVAPTELPPGVRIRSFAPGRDEAAFAAVRNAAFRTLAGSTPITAEDVAARVAEPCDTPPGIFLLEADGQAAGVVFGTRDAGDDGGEPAIEIGPLAVRPEFQGRGFGTLLLRHAIRYGQERAGLPRAVLSVNAENRGALALYLREGFEIRRGLHCLRQELAR